MTRTVAVIDLGKTNSKVALVDTVSAVELVVLTQPALNRVDTRYPSLNHEAIGTFIIESLRALSSDYTIDAITVTTHGATVALIDSTGQLVLPVLDYEFQGVDGIRDRYNEVRPPFSETGSPALPGGLNIGAQLYWQQTTYPESFASVTTILTWPQYWVYLLSGEKHNEASSLGAHSDLYNPKLKCYSTLVQSQNWTSLLPPTQLPGSLCGTLEPAIAQQTDLPETTTVHTGIHDSNASLVPHLLNNDDPFTVVSTGTWFIIMAIGSSSVELDELRDTLLNVNAFGDSVPSARFMGGRERDLLSIPTGANEASMDALLDDTDNPPMLMPSVVSGTGPFPRSETQWIGRELDEEDTLRTCTVSLYLALMTNECMQLIGSQGPIYVEGPLAHDLHYAQMLSVVSQRKVMVSDAQTGTSIGAAMLIAKPHTPPAYKTVEIATERASSMKRYAERWQKSLRDHSI